MRLDWVTLAPGDRCDVQSQDCFGAVANAYQISRYEVTNAQYTELLNAMAVIVDPNFLYTSSVAQDTAVGGIRRTGLLRSFV